MSGQDPRLPLARARSLADAVVGLLGHACHRIEIAGSIRRGRADVGDVEILAVPRNAPAHDLFGREIEPTDLLAARCSDLVRRGVLALRPDTAGRTAFGSKYKRLAYRGFALDLFVVTPPAQWGVLMALRTGPREFSHRLVTPRALGGFLPAGLVVRGGALRRTGVDPEEAGLVAERVVPTPEERDLFDALGLRYLEPSARTGEEPLAAIARARGGADA